MRSVPLKAANQGPGCSRGTCRIALVPSTIPRLEGGSTPPPRASTLRLGPALRDFLPQSHSLHLHLHSCTCTCLAEHLPPEVLADGRARQGQPCVRYHLKHQPKVSLLLTGQKGANLIIQIVEIVVVV